MGSENSYGANLKSWKQDQKLGTGREGSTRLYVQATSEAKVCYLRKWG